MKTINIKLWILAGLFLTFSSCKPEIDTPVATSGSADFSKYISIGNSLTAGFADGGLYREGQLVAYPNIVAQQLSFVGGGSFTSPFFEVAQANGSGYLRLSGFDASGSPILSQVTDNLAYRSPGLFIKNTSEIQNLGIPGMRLDLAFVPQFSALNNYFERLLPDAQVGTTSYFTFTQGRNHTFFSFWLGNNDVLGWATSGGVTTDATNVLTNKQTFAGAYSNFINALTSQGQEGIVATIPDVTSVPFFNTVTVAALLKGAQAVNPAAQAIFIQTSTGTRAATEKDLVVLTFQSTGLFGKPTAATNTTPANPYPYGLHPLNPIQNRYVLDEAEVAIAKDYVMSYNASIKAIATAKNLAIVDINQILNDVKLGEVYNGITVNSSFISGNAFSLDGVHLTPIGNAVIANEFINAINLKYNSNIPQVSVANYRGVKFP